MLNRVSLTGRVFERPVIKNSSYGKRYVTCFISVSRNRSQGNQFIEEIDQIPVLAFSNIIERFENLSKGSFVLIDGHITVSEWTDKSGSKRQNLAIVTDNIEVISQPDDKVNNDQITEEDIPF